jgi:DNA-binding NtrC family response regulator
MRGRAGAGRDLKAAVAERRFREDLLYRLEVLPLRVPSLAELARHFCAEACERHSLPRKGTSNAPPSVSISAARTSTR